MKTQKIVTIYVMASFFWISLCSLIMIYFSRSLLLGITQGLLAVCFLLYSRSLFRNIPNASNGPLPKGWYRVFILFLSVAILEIYLWIIEENRLRPSMGSIVFLVLGLGLIVITVFGLIAVFLAVRRDRILRL